MSECLLGGWDKGAGGWMEAMMESWWQRGRKHGWVADYGSVDVKTTFDGELVDVAGEGPHGSWQGLILG